MDGNTTSAGGGPVAAFLTDEQYTMLFGEPRPSTSERRAPSEARLAFKESSTTRWDRRFGLAVHVDV